MADVSKTLNPSCEIAGMRPFGLISKEINIRVDNGKGY